MRIKKITKNLFKVIFGNSFLFLKKYFQNYGIIGILGLVVFVTTSYYAIILYISLPIQNIFLGRYYDDYKNLNEVKLHYQIEYIIDLFGKPAIINQTKDGLKEYLFIKKGYILQVITDTGNKINGVGIVCIDLKFNYRIAGIELCKSNFEEISDDFFPLIESDGGMSNKHAEYYESYGGDGAHAYKYFVFGYNSLGYGFIGEDVNKIKTLGFTPYKEAAFSGNIIKKIRKETIINTYFISDQNNNGRFSVDGRERFGPDYYQLHYLIPIDLTLGITSEDK